MVKGEGKVTQEESMKELGLSATDLNAQLIPPMHSEMVKEHSEGNAIYLLPIG